MNAAPRTAAEPVPAANPITVRNRAVHELADAVFDAGAINLPARRFFTVVLNYCGEHTFTRARLRTLANALPGRSSAVETDGRKCYSTVRNYLRALEDADLVWLDEFGIHVTALEPRPALLQQEELQLQEQPLTLEQIADLVRAAMLRGDFAEVARLTALAQKLKAEPPADDRAKNCADETNNLAGIKGRNPDLNPSEEGGKPTPVQRPAQRPPTVAEVPPTPSVSALRRAGARVPAALLRHKDASLNQIARLSRQLQHIRNLDERGALLIYRLDCGIDADAPPPPLLAPAPTPATPPDSVQQPQDLWAAVIAAAAVDEEARQVWLAESALLQLTATTAVVGVPNVFARDMVAAHYAEPLAAELARRLGHTLRLEIVVGSG